MLKPDGSGLSFLQPPHFRTRMEGDLEDQIASRFGRKALILEESDVYKKEHNLLQLRHVENGGNRSGYRHGYDSDDDGILADEPTQSFRSRLEEYLNNQMGSGDIYTCPICYFEAHRRFRTNDSHNSDDEDSDEQEEDDVDRNYTMEHLTSYNKIDPMSMLGALDCDEFRVASSFCFGRVSLVKRHIRDDHKLDTSNVDGNDLYKSFLVRGICIRLSFIIFMHLLT